MEVLIAKFVLTRVRTACIQHNDRTNIDVGHEPVYKHTPDTTNLDLISEAPGRK